MPDAPKRIKRLLREYAAAAHEEELGRALLTIPGELLEHLGGAMRLYEEGQAASYRGRQGC